MLLMPMTHVLGQASTCCKLALEHQYSKAVRLSLVWRKAEAAIRRQPLTDAMVFCCKPPMTLHHIERGCWHARHEAHCSLSSGRLPDMIDVSFLSRDESSVCVVVATFHATAAQHKHAIVEPGHILPLS